MQKFEIKITGTETDTSFDVHVEVAGIEEGEYNRITVFGALEVAKAKLYEILEE